MLVTRTRLVRLDDLCDMYAVNGLGTLAAGNHSGSSEGCWTLSGHPFFNSRYFLYVVRDIYLQLNVPQLL